LKESDEDSGGSYRMAIRPTAVVNLAFLSDHQTAGIEGLKEVWRGVPGSSHPIGPSGQ
jgi:hypothetical protein